MGKHVGAASAAKKSARLARAGGGQAKACERLAATAAWAGSAANGGSKALSDVESGGVKEKYQEISGA